MGADGGLYWVRTTDETEFRRLVEPFDVLYWSKYHSCTNDAWIREHGEDDCVYASYGTGIDLDLEDLKWALITIDSIRQGDYDWTHAGWETYTLEEAVESVITLPDFYQSNHGLDGMLLGRWSKHHESVSLPADLKSMLLVDWADQIKAVIDVKSFGHVETWT